MYSLIYVLITNSSQIFLKLHFIAINICIINCLLTISETRILLVGKTGVGKSAVGNTILGQKLFETSVGSRVVVKSCEARSAIRFGRKLVVIDTPGFLDTDKHTEVTAREMAKLLCLIQPGFHVMIYVMGPEKFNDECIETRDVFLKVFGDTVTKFTTIIITHLDLLLEESFDPDDYLSLTTKEFRDFQKRCGHRVIFLNNKADNQTKDNQIQDLLKHIDDIDSSAGMSCFTNFYLRLVHTYCKLYDHREDINFNKAKRELLRRSSKQLNLELPLYWDYVKQIPVKKLKLQLPKDFDMKRKSSHHEIRPFSPLRFGPRTIPEQKPIMSRRYSVCADVSKMTLATAQKLEETKEEDRNVIEVQEEDLSEFQDEIVEMFDNIDRPFCEMKGEFMQAHEKNVERMNEKDFFEYFVNFFSFYLTPLVNVKKSHHRK